MIFYIYKLIPIVIATVVCIGSWKVTHYFIREIDKYHYVKGYVDNLKFPQKLIYYIYQILIICGLAIVPIFLIGQGLNNERMKKRERLFAYNLYIAALIGIGGYALIIYGSMLIADYYDLAALSRTLNLLGVYAAFFIAPYYVILGIKRLYRLYRNDTIQITKLGYKKADGVKKSQYLKKLFSEKLETETEEEFEIRRKEISKNWHYIYDNEEEWAASAEVNNNFTRIQPLFIKLLIIYVAINFIMLMFNYQILENEVVSIEVYNTYVYQGVKLVYITEVVIVGIFLINYLIGRPFKSGNRYLRKNILSVTNVVSSVTLFIIVTLCVQYIFLLQSPIGENGTADVYINRDWESVEVNAEGIEFIKANYVEKVKHQRDYESFTSYEKILSVMNHPNKFKVAIQSIGQDRVDSFGFINFKSDNALNKEEKTLYVIGRSHEIKVYDGFEKEDNKVNISGRYGNGEPEACTDDFRISGSDTYNNENLCALEQDMLNAVESLYTEVFDDKMLGIKSDYVTSEIK